MENEKMQEITIQKDIFEIENINSATIKKYLKGGGNASDEELAMLLTICRNNKMNPFLKEVYFVKYANQPAQIIVARDFYRKRALENQNFEGLEVGLIVRDSEGIHEVNGAFKTPEQELLGAWARVTTKNENFPFYVAVSYSEYVQMKDGHPNTMWTNKPCTMLAKVAESQALRMAFPSEFSGTYSDEEFTEIDEEIKDVTPHWNKEERAPYVKKKISELKEENEKLKKLKKNVTPLDEAPEPLEIIEPKTEKQIEMEF